MPIVLGTMGVRPFVGAQGPASRVWGITIKIYIFGFKIVNFFFLTKETNVKTIVQKL